MGRHPEHDAVSREVRRWYTASTPEIGMSVVEGPYGFLTTSDRADRRRLVLTDDAPRRVPDALAAAGAFYRSSDFEVWVDDRSRADRLDAALVSAGLEPVQDTVVLALVGPIRAAPGPDGLAIDDVVDPAGLREWATVKIQGFADSDDPPTADQVRTEVSERQAEWPVCRYQAARLDGRLVGILGHYTGEHQMVFLLATRVPYRRRGIAQTMLARWSRQAEAEKVRSLLINCDDGGPAAALYRRMGFTDEVYWLRRYRTTR